MDIERVDALCSCGWGLLAIPAENAPGHCPQCGFRFNEYDGQSAEAEANARLIAAAPDMLAALECLTSYAESRWFKDTNGRMDSGTTAPIEHIKLARAAIAKTRGES